MKREKKKKKKKKKKNVYERVDKEDQKLVTLR